MFNICNSISVTLITYFIRCSFHRSIFFTTFFPLCFVLSLNSRCIFILRKFCISETSNRRNTQLAAFAKADPVTSYSKIINYLYFLRYERNWSTNVYEFTLTVSTQFFYARWTLWTTNFSSIETALSMDEHLYRIRGNWKFSTNVKSSVNLSTKDSTRNDERRLFEVSQLRQLLERHRTERIDSVFPNYSFDSISGMRGTTIAFARAFIRMACQAVDWNY